MARHDVAAVRAKCPPQPGKERHHVITLVLRQPASDSSDDTNVVFLKEASVEQVRQSTEQMLRVGSRRGRFIAGCNTSPLDYIPAENYRAMTETITAYRHDISA